MSYFTFFFFNDTATTEIYTLSLHDALPICDEEGPVARLQQQRLARRLVEQLAQRAAGVGMLGGRALHTRHRACRRRSEEHTSELQSPYDLVCRLLLEKKKKKKRKKLITQIK